MTNPVFDKAGALERVDNDWDLLEELVSLFFQEYTQQLADLHAALNAGEAERFKRLAHTVKGAAGNVGAMYVFDLALRLEKSAAANALGEARTLLPQFEAAVADFKRIFDAAVR